MPSTEDIKARICTVATSPDYPVDTLVAWAEREHHREMLRCLQQIELELYEEELAWSEAAAFGNVTTASERTTRWRHYCAQVKAYYQSIVGERDRKKRLRSLLFGQWSR
jgi:hypothetical protein